MHLYSVEGNYQSLDGGSMFGNVPRALWQKWLEPDAEHRVRLACRGLLAKDLDGKNVLFEVGIGAFFPPELRERFGVDGDHNELIDSLSACGVAEDIGQLLVLEPPALARLDRLRRKAALEGLVDLERQR